MATIEIYENFGVLAAEKRSVYTYGEEHPRAICSEKMTVEIPEGWELYENNAGEMLLEAPWGWNYEINEILSGDKRPEFRVMNKDMRTKVFELKIVESQK